MAKISKAYRIKIQKIINSKPKGSGYTTAKIFSKQWAEYDRQADAGIISKKEAAQKKRNFGRAFTNAVKRGEYKNIRYTDKNKQKASTFRIF